MPALIGAVVPMPNVCRSHILLRLSPRPQPKTGSTCSGPARDEIGVRRRSSSRAPGRHLRSGAAQVRAAEVGQIAADRRAGRLTDTSTTVVKHDDYAARCAAKP